MDSTGTVAVRAALLNAPGWLASASAWDRSHHRSRPRTVLLLAAGFSAHAARSIAALARGCSILPVVVETGYDIPAWADTATLVVAVSPSGMDSEVIHSVSKAIDQGCAVWTITSLGGLLDDIAGAQNFAAHHVECDTSQPAAEYMCAFWSTYGMLWDVLALDDPGQHAVVNTLGVVQQLSAYHDGLLGVPSPARALAEVLRSRAVTLYASPGGIGAAALAWAAWMQAGPKLPCTVSLLNECRHDQLLTWDRAASAADSAGLHQGVVVVLQDASDTGPLAEQQVAVMDRVRASAPGVGVHAIRADGATDLDRCLSALILGMWTAGYLADESPFA